MEERPQGDGAGGRRSVLARLVAPLRIVVALAILAWVGSNLPWTDHLLFVDAAGIEQGEPVPGELVGDWKSDEVRFVPAEPVETGPGWPDDTRAALARGEAIAATRRGGGGAGFDWNPGMPHAFREMDAGHLLFAQALFFLATLTIVTRWWRLLHLAECPTSWPNAFRLTFLGLFFNNVMPGATGGDLVKGVLVAKENKGRGAEALMTVFVDRVFGIVALALLALVVTLVSSEEGFRPLRLNLAWGLGAVAVGGALYASKRVRRKTGLSALVDRLPLREKLRSLDRAALAYLKQPGPMAVAFLFSFLNHVLVTCGVFFLGLSLGVVESDVSIFDYFVIVPVANIIGAVPLAPGGWGLGELAYGGLFRMIGASAAMGVAVSVSFRLSMLVLGLVGGVFLLLPGSRSELRDARQEEEI